MKALPKETVGGEVDWVIDGLDISSATRLCGALEEDNKVEKVGRAYGAVGGAWQEGLIANDSNNSVNPAMALCAMPNGPIDAVGCEGTNAAYRVSLRIAAGAKALMRPAIEHGWRVQPMDAIPLRRAHPMEGGLPCHRSRAVPWTLSRATAVLRAYTEHTRPPLSCLTYISSIHTISLHEHMYVMACVTVLTQFSLNFHAVRLVCFA